MPVSREVLRAPLFNSTRTHRRAQTRKLFAARRTHAHAHKISTISVVSLRLRDRQKKDFSATDARVEKKSDSKATNFSKDKKKKVFQLNRGFAFSIPAVPVFQRLWSPLARPRPLRNWIRSHQRCPTKSTGRIGTRFSGNSQLPEAGPQPFLTIHQSASEIYEWGTSEMTAWDGVGFISSTIPDARETVPVKIFPSPWASRRAGGKTRQGPQQTATRLGVIQSESS